jgi:hypothetical protein
MECAPRLGANRAVTRAKPPTCSGACWPRNPQPRDEQNFRALYNSIRARLGDTDTINGAVSLGWFTQLFGAWVLNRGWS